MWPQRILDFVVALRLPRAVFEDSFLYVNRVLAHVASTLLMSLPLPNCLADLQELDLLPEKIVMELSSVLEKIALLLHVRAVELFFKPKNCR